MVDPLDLSAVLRDPARIDAVPVAQLPALLTQLSTLQTAMAARLIVGERGEPQKDTMLSVEDAAARLGVSTDWLYRRTKTLPFVVHLGRHVRFSAQGIDRYLKRHTGR